MKHENFVTIYHHDTDCYGIVWHGAYLKWFEIGRIELSRMAGIDFKILDEMNILLPVVEINCRYKSSGRLFDELSITTEIKELRKASVTFQHSIINVKTGVHLLTATTTIVTTNQDGKLYRSMPDYLYLKYNNLIENQHEQKCYI